MVATDASRLRIQQHSLWSLRSLPMKAEREWTLDEKFSRVKAEGFEGVECWLTDENERDSPLAGRRRTGPCFPLRQRSWWPPRYAITLPDDKELSDHWEQSLVMKRL